MSVNVPVDTDPTMSAIRSILHEPAPSNAPSGMKAKAKVALAASLHAVKAPQVEVSKDAAMTDEADLFIADDIDNERTAKLSLLSKLRLSFQPTRKHAAWAGIGLLAFFRPHWFVLTFILCAFVILGVLAIFGADKVWGGLMRFYSRFAARFPERAQRISSKMDRVAMRRDSMLDIFPDGMVDGLYLPDFQSIQEAEDRHEAVVDARLSRMQAEG